ncbi:MAG TPA: DinB family protein [Cyclobacteriaceae bacterium]|jgi:uncharacterized damage-inducible protein DinB|nr:DinB family protein [Cyclobacteriaceae bacterium]
MNARLQDLYNKIETQRRTLLLSLKDLSYDKLNTHLPTKWSINQIIAHLITAEDLSIAYLHKKILGINELEDSGLLEELKMILLIVSQRLPLKFKAPKIVVAKTSDETDLNKLIAKWDLTRLELKNILDPIESHHIKRKVYRHVRVGMLNIQHTLKFIGEHVGHHTPQIKKLLKQK